MNLGIMANVDSVPTRSNPYHLFINHSIRLLSLNEVHRRHETDLDKIVDDLVSSQSEIQNLESRIPVYAERHRFFQDLRGYVTDLVECFNEKVSPGKI